MAAFVAWITSYGSIIGFFIQMGFYLVVAGSAVWAAATFAHYVKYMTSDDAETAAISTDVSVEEFVE